jgi:hypothetical protein
MTCHERRDAIFLFAAGALEECEERVLAVHLLSGCARCAGALGEAREALALIARSLDPVPPPAGARERLLARVAASPFPPAARGRASQDVGARAPRRRGAARRAAIAAGIGLAIGAGAGGFAAWRAGVAPLAAQVTALDRELAAARADLADLGAALAEQDRDLAALEDEARLASEALDLLRADGLEVMVLAAEGREAGPSARIYWESGDYDCYFHAEGMAPPPAGRRYVLWVVSARGEPIAAATFAPDARGEAAVVTRLPRDSAPIARAFVTEEDAEHGPAPSGGVRLEGTEIHAARS